MEAVREGDVDSDAVAEPEGVTLPDTCKHEGREKDVNKAAQGASRRCLIVVRIECVHSRY
jgi:hypothetical protein